MPHDMTPDGKRPDTSVPRQSQNDPPDMTTIGPTSSADDDGPDPKHITGQVFVRETGAVTMDGRRLLRFAGVIALEKGTLQGEHQYAVLGRVDPDNGIVRLSVIPETAAQDLTVQARGKSIDDMLNEPIWIT